MDGGYVGKCINGSNKVKVKVKDKDKNKVKDTTPVNVNRVMSVRPEPTKSGVKIDAIVLMRDLEAGDVGLMDKDTRRRARNLAVDYNLSNLRSTKIPDHVLGFLVKSLHFHTPFYFLLMFLLLPYKVAPYVMLPLVACLIAFFYFDGCFLTIIEYRLMGGKDDMNIIDPYIYALGSVPTPKRRFYYTLGVTSGYFGLVLVLMGLRVLNASH